MTKKKLFLTSSFSDVAHHFPAFLNENPKGKSVAFIPTASIPEEVKSYMDDDRNAFLNLGMWINELEISAMNEKEIKETLSQSDYIFVGGGNTFFLLQELRRSGAFTLLKEDIENGKPYIGTSAGSVILSPSVEYVKDVDDANAAKELTSFEGLNVVDFYTLPHFKSEPFTSIIDRVFEEYSDQINLIAISNTQAIEVIGDSIRIID